MLCRQAAVLVKRAVRTEIHEAWDLTLPQGTALPSLGLQDNCQCVFYRSIQEIKTQTVAPRKFTAANLGGIHDAKKKKTPSTDMCPMPKFGMPYGPVPMEGHSQYTQDR
jgi:hypothetical protein